MCGVVGAGDLGGEPVATAIIKRMSDAIAYRGPDGEGQFTDGPVGLGHRRLAIIDLSPSASQPMANASGDLVLVYNGEIYNYQTLKLELEALGYQFRSRSDTEVLLH